MARIDAVDDSGHPVDSKTALLLLRDIFGYPAANPFPDGWDDIEARRDEIAYVEKAFDECEFDFEAAYFLENTDQYLEIHEIDVGEFDYTIYDRDFNVVDGGQATCGETVDFDDFVRDDILKPHGIYYTNYSDCRLMPYATLVEGVTPPTLSVENQAIVDAMQFGGFEYVMPDGNENSVVFKYRLDDGTASLMNFATCDDAAH